MSTKTNFVWWGKNEAYIKHKEEHCILVFQRTRPHKVGRVYPTHLSLAEVGPVMEGTFFPSELLL